MEPSQPPQPEVQAPPAAESTGPKEPETGTAAPGPAERLRAARARRKRAFRQVLLIGFCFVSLLCLGGVAAGFLFYHQATKPDLSTPEHVTRKYIEGYLVDRDEYATRQYQCADSSGLAELRALRDDIDARQRTYGVTISVSADRVRQTDTSGNTATVAVDLVLTAIIQGDPQKDTERWEFTVRNQDGWHVCAAHEVT